MAYMVSASINIHWVTRIEASSNTEGVIKLIFHGDPEASTEQFNMTEVLVFTEDAVLVDRLVAAINGAVQ